MSDKAVTEPSVAGDAAPTIDRRSIITEARREHLREIGQRGGRALVKKRGRAHMAAIGQRGGDVTAEYSYEDRRDWGMKGWEARKQNRSGAERRTESKKVADLPSVGYNEG
jgi:hypothetical protein